MTDHSREFITLYLHHSYNKVRLVMVDPTDNISSLNIFHKYKKNFRYIYKGELVPTNYSFKFYNIKEGEHIYVVSTEKANAADEFYFDLLDIKKIEELFTKMRDARILEITKKRDLILSKEDSNTKLHRFLSHKYEMIMNEEIESPEPCKLCLGAKALFPSTEELPCFWTVDSQDVPQ